MASSPEEEDDGQLARPSTWKLLFGKNKNHPQQQQQSVADEGVGPGNSSSSNNNDDDHGHHNHSNNVRRNKPVSPQPPSLAPNITDHLLAALAARTGGHLPDDERIGRECSEQLLGKRNAFVSQFRVDEDPEQATEQDATKRQAREIINARFYVDNKAQAIRQGKQQEHVRRDDRRLRPAKAVAVAVAVRGPISQTATPAAAERLNRLRVIQSRRDEREEAQQQQQQQQQDAIKKKPVRATATVANSVQQTPPSSRPASDGMRAKPPQKPTQRQPAAAPMKIPSNQDESMGPPPPRVRGTTPSQQPRPTKVQQSTKAVNKQPPIATTIHQFRLLDEKLRQLKAENQQVAELEEKLFAQQHLLQVKRRVWAIWRERVIRRQRQETSVTRAFQWRRLQHVWAEWRNYTRVVSREHEAERTRALMVREKQSCELADRFYRRKQLPLWFLQWRSVASAMRDARVFENEMRKRREKAQRLMDRFARTGTAGTGGGGGGGGDVEDNQSSSPARDESDHNAEDTKRTAVELKTTRQKAPPPPPQRVAPSRTPQNDPKPPTKLKPKAAWVEDDHTASSHDHNDGSSIAPASLPLAQKPTKKSAPSPDAFYVSMQERAEQRKQQREQLKHKYEQLEQAKREALAAQVAEREALLEKQKHDEREQVKQRKREEARVARAKETAREVETIKQQSAQLHDRLRLLFHYAWRPWQSLWLTRKRITSHAIQWHAMRVCHHTWLTWLAFVHERRHQRRRRERERLDMATQHYSHTLLRRALTKWTLAQQETQQKELALSRQTQWNQTRRVWRCWHRQFVVVVSQQLKKQQQVRRRLDGAMMRRVLTTWHNAAAEIKKEKVRQAEKELLWKKARLWLNDS